MPVGCGTPSDGTPGAPGAAVTAAAPAAGGAGAPGATGTWARPRGARPAASANPSPYLFQRFIALFPRLPQGMESGTGTCVPPPFCRKDSAFASYVHEELAGRDGSPGCIGSRQKLPKTINP